MRSVPQEERRKRDKLRQRLASSAKEGEELRGEAARLRQEVGRSWWMQRRLRGSLGRGRTGHTTRRATPVLGNPTVVLAAAAAPLLSGHTGWVGPPLPPEHANPLPAAAAAHRRRRGRHQRAAGGGAAGGAAQDAGGGAPIPVAACARPVALPYGGHHKMAPCGAARCSTHCR